jgi:GT2 family glycosyltransferase
MIRPKETVSLAWCDNGMVDGKFAEGIAYTLLMGPQQGVIINNAMRVQGNQIGRQRQVAFDKWADDIKTDWILWVDSDIYLTVDVMKKIWQAADKELRPIVSGVYFISKENEGSVMRPFPCIFKNISEFEIQYIHPLPIDKVVEVDSAGMGFVLMHKSIVPKLRAKYPNQSMFAEQEGLGEKFVGEDIVFFRKVRDAGIPVHAHTGALVRHMKRFSLDVDYYALYWNTVAMQEEALKLKEEAEKLKPKE